MLLAATQGTQESVRHFVSTRCKQTTRRRNRNSVFPATPSGCGLSLGGGFSTSPPVFAPSHVRDFNAVLFALGVEELVDLAGCSPGHNARHLVNGHQR